MARKPLTFALLALLTITAHAQHFDWVKTYSGPDNTDGTPANEILGSVMDREGNVYILGQFIGGARWDDDTGILPFTAQRNRGALIAKYSSSGTLVWHKELFCSYSDMDAYTIRMIGDSAIMVFVGVLFPFNHGVMETNELYYLDTLLTTPERFPEELDSLQTNINGANAFITMSLENGNVIEEHFFTQAYVKTDGSLLRDRSGNIETRGGDITFNVDSEGNIILIRRTGDFVSQPCDTCPSGYITWSPSDGNINVLRLLFDGGTVQLDVPLEPSFDRNFQIIKLSPHFDSVIGSTYIFDSTWRYTFSDMITTRFNSIDIGDNGNVYISLAREGRNDPLPIKNSQSLAMEWISCVVQYTPALMPTGIAQVTASLTPDGHNAGGMEILSTFYDTVTNSLFLRGTASRLPQYTTLNYNGDTLNIMNNACWLRLDADDLRLISYGKARSTANQSWERTYLTGDAWSRAHNGSFAVANNRVFCQVKYQTDILFMDSIINLPYGMGLFIWDYDGHEAAYIDYNANSRDNKHGYIHLKDSSAWITGTIASNADFGEFHINSANNSSAYLARYTDTVFMTPYVYIDPRAEQSIEWEQELSFPLSASPIALTATASSGLPVSYSCTDTSIAKVVGSLLYLFSAGTTTVTAYQNGSQYGYYPATPITKNLTGEVSITLVEGGNAFVAYPNPFRQSVRIKVQGGQLKEHNGTVTAILTDLTGRREEVHLTPDGPGQYSLDLTSRPQATYLLTLTTADGKRHTVRLLKQSDIFGQ